MLTVVFLSISLLMPPYDPKQYAIVVNEMNIPESKVPPVSLSLSICEGPKNVNTARCCNTYWDHWPADHCNTPHCERCHPLGHPVHGMWHSRKCQDRHHPVSMHSACLRHVFDECSLWAAET